MRRTLIITALAAALPGALAAQGALAIQGYGYPTGQLGAGSVGLGSASAELDPASAINPAALSASTRFSVYMQFQPEFRRTSVGGTSDKSTLMVLMRRRSAWASRSVS